MGLFFAGVIVLLIAGLVAAIVNGFVSPLKVHYRVRIADIEATPVPTEPQGAPFVGLALSGGGARAAVFSAAGMKALDARGLLEAVTDVSSVSGGGFAASYLALHPVPQNGSSAGYFDRMMDVVAADYFREIQIRQVKNPLRAFSPSRRLVSLQEALDNPDFVRDARFSDLPEDRNFYFNAISYDTAQRVVLSNCALPAANATTAKSVLPPRLRALTFSDVEALRSTPGGLPVSLAVATSAAFPPYLGPTTIQVDGPDGSASRYLHLGDGGVFENSGTETLREAIYSRGPKQNATIYVFNAGLQRDPDLSQNTLDISIWSRDVTRLVDVVVEYADAHRRTMFDMQDEKYSMAIAEVEFNYMDIVHLAAAGNAPDARWVSWDLWENATMADRNQSKTPAEHLAKIPTGFRISRLNRDLIAAAAEDLVAIKFPTRDASK